MNKLIIAALLAGLQPFHSAFATNNGEDESKCGKIVKFGTAKAALGEVKREAQPEVGTVISLVDRVRQMREKQEAKKLQGQASEPNAQMIAVAKADWDNMLGNLKSIATNLLKGVRILIKRYGSAERRDGFVDMRWFRDAQAIMKAVNLGYPFMIESLPLLYHPGVEQISDSDSAATLKEIKKDFVLLDQILKHERFNELLKKLDAKIQPLNSYSEKLLKDFYPDEVGLSPAQVAWEFDFPFYNRPTKAYLDEGIAIIIKQNFDLWQLLLQFSEYVRNDRLVETLLADPAKRKNFREGFDGYAGIIAQLVSNLKILAGVILQSMPPQFDVMTKVDGLFYVAIDALESQQLKDILAREAAVEKASTLVPWTRKERFKSLPQDIQDLKDLRQKLSAKRSGNP